MIRDPAVSGSFYPGRREALHAMIENCIEYIEEAKKKEVTGIVVPHAGYVYSGKVAGAVYSRLKFPDTFVILGPNHTGMGNSFSIMSRGVWNMPFGSVNIDSILAEKIFINSKYLEEDILSHVQEHSIEVQIPFMQYFSKKFQIVPITVKHYIPDENFLKICREIGIAIAKGIKMLNEKVIVVASSDFSHYEPQEVANKNDNSAIEAIIKLDERELFKRVKALDISMCGYGPVAIMLSACKELGATKSELVKYMTSGEVTGDYGEVVGYGGVIVK